MMFRRSTTRYGTTPEPVTPYQKAAQAWDERIGSARIQARNWRLMAFGSLFLSAGLGAGLVWQSMRGTITPWVVQVDRLGQAQVVAPATAGYMPTDPQIAWYLAQFLHDVRALSSDPVVVRQNWLRSYDFTTTSGAQALNDYARLNDPFSRIGHEQVEVDIASVIRASPGSFRVAWTERHYRDGAFVGTERWTAIVSVVLRTPRDADHLRKNPLGIYVSAINWSKELGQ
ncbi:Conjugal transfer protein trbF [Gluconobacter oxydans H24]|nr:Conjugal transfer protein trbF [Gluconobacter oxydans H24]